MNKNPEIQFRSPEKIKAYQESRLADIEYHNYKIHKQKETLMRFGWP